MSSSRTAVPVFVRALLTPTNYRIAAAKASRRPNGTVSGTLAGGARLTGRSTELAEARASGPPWRSPGRASRARDGANASTAAGAAISVGEAYRSVRGRICRDVRQSVELSRGPREQQVTLCRDDQGDGLSV
jgi:hypothetical protein